MPRNISFMLTTPQFIDGSKDVTRRLGWTFLRPGDLLMGVEKSQGLGKGGKIKRLGLIEVVSMRREPLSAMVDDLVYGYRETAREGFPVGTAYSDPFKFIQWFGEGHRIASPHEIVTRIEFKHADQT